MENKTNTHCEKCGAEIKPSFKFCGKCGFKLKSKKRMLKHKKQSNYRFLYWD